MSLVLSASPWASFWHDSSRIRLDLVALAVLGPNWLGTFGMGIPKVLNTALENRPSLKMNFMFQPSIFKDMFVPRRVYAKMPLDIMNSPSKCGKTLCVFFLHGEFDGEMRHHEPASFGHKMCLKLAVPTACRSCIIVCENAGHGEKPCQLPSYLNCLLVCNEKKSAAAVLCSSSLLTKLSVPQIEQFNLDFSVGS